MARILVVDDDPKTVRTIELYLEREGHVVLTAHDGHRALLLARAGTPDLIILDLMLPEIDGVDVARLIRGDGDTPIIMVTARVQEEDSLAGFKAGADDYVRKPFSPRELVARVRALLRRQRASEDSVDTLMSGPLALNRVAHTVRWNGTVVDLTPTEFRLLEVLLSNPGRVFPRSELIDRVMGINYPGVDRSIDTHISNLRGKLRTVTTDDPMPETETLIVTVHGIGFKLATIEHA